MAIHTDIRSSGKDSGRSGSSRQQLASTPASSFPEKLTLKWRLAHRELQGVLSGSTSVEGKKETGLGRGQSRASIQCHLRPQLTLRGSFETRVALQNCPELMQGSQASSVRARALLSQGPFPPQLPPMLQGLLEHVIQMARPLVLQPGPTADPTQSWRYLGVT